MTSPRTPGTTHRPARGAPTLKRWLDRFLDLGLGSTSQAQAHAKPGAHGAKSYLARLRGLIGRLGTLINLALRESSRDGILLTSSALAYVTILSLIPLLVSFTLIGRAAFPNYQTRLVDALLNILPYSEVSIVARLEEFLAQAESLQGFGLTIFFVTVLFTFATIEETINRIWNVSRRRPFKARLLSFTMVMFWGPLLIGATFSILLILRRNPRFDMLLEQSIVLSAVPFLVTLLGLSMLYWLAPFTRVRFGAAIAGGATAAVMLELLRNGFGLYVTIAKGVNVIYGSFALALLFAVSIQIAWSIVLFGSELAFTVQYFRPLTRRRSAMIFNGRWAGLAAIAVVASRLAKGDPITDQNHLAEHLGLPPEEIETVLRPLLSSRLIETSPGGDGYMLSQPPHKIEVDSILKAFEERSRAVFSPVGVPLRGRLTALASDVAKNQNDQLGPMTLAELIEGDVRESGPS